MNIVINLTYQFPITKNTVAANAKTELLGNVTRNPDISGHLKVGIPEPLLFKNGLMPRNKMKEQLAVNTVEPELHQRIFSWIT